MTRKPKWHVQVYEGGLVIDSYIVHAWSYRTAGRRAEEEAHQRGYRSTRYSIDVLREDLAQV